MARMSGKLTRWIWRHVHGLSMSRDLAAALRRHQVAADALDAAVKEMLKP